MDYAVIDNTGLVVNVVQWDGSTPWEPPAGHIALPLLDGGIGWTFADGRFVSPQPPEAEGDLEPDSELN